MEMNQTKQVIEVMRKLGGFATFGKLNQMVDFSTWKTKTPENSVRRIVQDSSEIFKIKPGLWALKEYESEILNKFNIIDGNEENVADFSHSYYQGLTVEIGNLRSMKTYVPNQDKNKLFLDKPLREVVNVPDIYEFTYPELLRHAKTVFKSIKDRVKFKSYTALSEIHNSAFKHSAATAL